MARVRAMDGLQNWLAGLACARCGRWFPTVLETAVEKVPGMWLCKPDCSNDGMDDSEEFLREVGDEVVPFIRRGPK